MSVDIGKIIQERYKDKWKQADEKRADGLCCVPRCRNPYTCIYMGFPLCEKHVQKLEREIEKIPVPETKKEEKPKKKVDRLKDLSF